MKQPRVAMVAGEASGDLLAGLLMDGLRARWPGLISYGIGGPQMQARAFQVLWPSKRLALHGYSVELLMGLLGAFRMRAALRRRLLRDQPDLFIGVDAPDFNLGLERALRRAGIKTVHFVCPSIWAWRAKRVDKLRASASHVLCLFPFEPELLASHGIAASYVGHPLASVIPMRPDKQAARTQLGLPEDAEVLAILPGSRDGEIAHIARPFFQAAALLQKARPGLHLITPVVTSAQRTGLERIARACGIQLTLLEGQSHTALAACDCSLIASGTATLEAALFKRPMVIAYHMHPISWHLMRHKQLQPWIGLPNILCREFIVPELLQNAATPQALADAVTQWLDAPADRLAALQQRFSALHEDLRRDTPRLAVDAIEKLLA